MLCPDCHGKGLVETPAGPGRQRHPWPCPGCSGVGVVHCCEGLQAQPGEGSELPLSNRAGTAWASEG